MLKVAQGAQLGLKEYAPARGRRRVEEAARVAYEGQERLGIALYPVHQLAQRMALSAIDARERQVLPFEQLCEPLPELFGIVEVSRLQRLFLVLIRVKRRYALTSRAELVRAQPRLLQRVLLPVPGQEQARPVAYHEVVWCYVNSAGPHLGYFLREALQVERHAGAEDVHDPGPEDARGQQVQGELAPVIYDRVPGVAAALIAHYDVVVRREQVYHTALALVAPVYSHYRAVRHFASSIFSMLLPLAP